MTQDSKTPNAIAKLLAPLALVHPVNLECGREEDGYDLWLRYRPLAGEAKARLAARAASIVAPTDPSTTMLAAVAELHRATSCMLGTAPALGQEASDGALVLATPALMPKLALHAPLERLGPEGYTVRADTIDGKRVTLIAANGDIGVLYGVFAWLRAVLLGRDLEHIDEVSAPKVRLRMLNHWDNLDRTIERGYAGESIWDWWKLPDVKEQRYVDYARANASLGINAVSLNNVSSRPEMLLPQFIAKAAALADVFRPYGIRVYFAARFSAPVELDRLPTADPLDPKVRAWWNAKADEIYEAIPDFGGFVVKANSEGQPGPHDYGRDHADGANMMARALAPHGGLVLWRAFVYSPVDPEDRHKQAYTDFKPLDGKFLSNVMVQVKNGAIDFQPREPFHPMFGAMPKTPLVLEFQVTKEYLGFATHLAYLGTMYEEVLRADTHANGPGSIVAKVVDGSLHDYSLTGMAAVSNIGSHRTWCGSHFDQANWYAYGRLTWDPYASARDIARDWAVQTFATDAATTGAIVEMMMMSREAVVDYMMPLGLHHLFDTGHHHGPGPWVSELARPEWNPAYYHQADKEGIGFDRTAKGSNAISQYEAEAARPWADPRTTPDELLLWFHHLKWDYRMKSGKTLWEELVAHYDRGVAAAVDLRKRWDALKGHVDARRHAETATLLRVQEREALWWRDACIAYFQSVNGLPMPAGTTPPALTLAEYKSRVFPYAPGRG
ncbi:MAG: alpha-glucuronidase family glycosyl hydrolase [Usitatibacter sp.]